MQPRVVAVEIVGYPGGHPIPVVETNVDQDLGGESSLRIIRRTSVAGRESGAQERRLSRSALDSGRTIHGGCMKMR